MNLTPHMLINAPLIDNVHLELSAIVSDINELMCGDLNRTGLHVLCG